MIMIKIPGKAVSLPNQHMIVHKFRQNQICDQICQKGSYTRTVSRHTFHRHLLATSMHQQDVFTTAES